VLVKGNKPAGTDRRSEKIFDHKRPFPELWGVNHAFGVTMSMTAEAADMRYRLHRLPNRLAARCPEFLDLAE
jgi:hypothetical protein